MADFICVILLYEFQPFLGEMGHHIKGKTFLNVLDYSSISVSYVCFNICILLMDKGITFHITNIIMQSQVGQEICMENYDNIDSLF